MNRNMLVAAILAVVCVAHTTASDTLKRSSAMTVDFQSLWTSAAFGIPAMKKSKAPTVAFCEDPKTPCNITVNVIETGSKCRLEINPEVLVVVAKDVTISWTVGNSKYMFAAYDDIAFHNNQNPKDWNFANLAKEKVTATNPNKERKFHQYDVVVHPLDAAKRGCGTDPIIVNTG